MKYIVGKLWSYACYAYICILSLLFLICDVVDEVESLAAARQAALSGSEPSDSIRVWFTNPFAIIVWICVTLNTCV